MNKSTCSLLRDVSVKKRQTSVKQRNRSAQVSFQINRKHNKPNPISVDIVLGLFGPDAIFFSGDILFQQREARRCSSLHQQESLSSSSQLSYTMQETQGEREWIASPPFLCLHYFYCYCRKPAVLKQKCRSMDGAWDSAEGSDVALIFRWTPIQGQSSERSVETQWNCFATATQKN